MLAAVALNTLAVTAAHAQQPVKAPTVYFLEEADGTQWCAYRDEAKWHAKMDKTPATIFGTLTYVHDLPSRFDLAETDGAGEWAVNDHYLFDAKGQIVRLTRLTNTRATDMSVAQTFTIGDAGVRETAASAKQLSTGKPVAQLVSTPPRVPVATSTRMLPFAVLLGHTGLRTSERFCVPARGAAAPLVKTPALTPNPPAGPDNGLPAAPTPTNPPQ